MTATSTAISILDREDHDVRDDLHDKPRVTFADRFLVMLAIVLAGYAMGGRGFAYIGLPPLFIGEITLAVGGLAYINLRGWLAPATVWPALALLPLVAMGLIRTIPFVSVYQVDALRDAVLWGYSAYGVILAATLISAPGRIERLIRWYDRFIKVFLITVPVIFLYCRFFRVQHPMWPWAPVPIIQCKEGDIMVHLAGMLAFWVAGLGQRPRWYWLALMAANVAMLGVVDRAGMVSYLAVAAVCICFKPLSDAPWRLFGAMVAALAVLAISGLSIEVPGGKGRAISFDQIVTNVGSIGGDTGQDGLDSTKEWRVQWWKDIYHYTFEGRYFWKGKGFGISLADDDGYQVGDKTLRSPHNVHMTVLARMGVPGLLFWATLQATWLLAILMAYRKARREKEERWSALFLWLGAFFTAFVTNGSFDVFIEGPMGGIWYWSLWGAGIGALWIFKYRRAELA